ncbi:ABC transporter ATP-binding protein, partial [Saprospiraceae bacterium]|nr:ABC transporter ATP-binding protein [Saprospiraceae bacterium]
STDQPKHKNMIRIDNILKKYGHQVVLDIDNLDFVKGEICGIVGNNGAGKTTLFSLILDLIKADQGTVYSKDIIVSHGEQWKPYTGAYINESFLIDFLTPEEYFEFIAELYNWNKGTLSAFLEQFEELFNGEILGGKKYIRDLSMGNQKKTGIVSALIGDPEIIILDEPFANLDPTTQNRLKHLITDMKTPDRTILISSHDLNHVHDASDRIVVLEKGKVVSDIQKSESSLGELKSYFQV